MIFLTQELITCGKMKLIYMTDVAGSDTLIPQQSYVMSL